MKINHFPFNSDEKITTQCVPFCLRPQQEDKCHVSPLSTYRIYFPHLPNIVPSQLDNRALLADRANLVWYGLALVATVSQWMFNYNYMTSQSAHGDRLTNVEQAITLLPDQLAVLRKTLQTYELSVEQTKRALNSIQTELNLQRSQIGATTKDAEQALVEAKVGQHISTELAAVQASAKTTQETVHSMMKDMEKLDAAIGALERKQSELQAKAFSVPVLAPYNTPRTSGSKQCDRGTTTVTF
jgi:septal ring factor EnvC (AmiA/AmiB activator)